MTPANQNYLPSVPPTELRDAWQRLLLIDKAVQDLREHTALYGDPEAQKIITRIERALRGLS